MEDEERDGRDEDDVVSLLRAAGTRLGPSPERTADARAFFDSAWRTELRQRRARSAWLRAAAVLAALAGAAVALRTTALRPPAVARSPLESAAAVARVDVALGQLEAEGESGWTPLVVGDSLPAGRRVRTGAFGGGLRAPDGRSVRLGPQSRLLWDTALRLSLESGGVYVDSGGGDGGGSSFEVLTPWGAVRETGTQFEVRLEPNRLRVRVREGRVNVVGRAPAVEVARGMELLLGDREAVRREIPVHGGDWSWTLELSPTFEIDGRPPHAFLVWAAREAGWELRYADDESRRRAQAARLHGSIRGLRPDAAVASVLPSTGLPHRLQDGVLWIGPSESAPR